MRFIVNLLSVPRAHIKCRLVVPRLTLKWGYAGCRRWLRRFWVSNKLGHKRRIQSHWNLGFSVGDVDSNWLTLDGSGKSIFVLRLRSFDKIHLKFLVFTWLECLPILKKNFTLYPNFIKILTNHLAYITMRTDRNPNDVRVAKNRLCVGWKSDRLTF